MIVIKVLTSRDSNGNRVLTAYGQLITDIAHTICKHKPLGVATLPGMVEAMTKCCKAMGIFPSNWAHTSIGNEDYFIVTTAVHFETNTTFNPE